MNPRSENFYCIHVQGALDPSWETWFDGLTLTNEPFKNETCIKGTVPDQTALHGMLMKIRDLNLVLISVERQP